jgi:hypothetical protein
MPFDGLRNATLAERLTWMGITPVPDDVLERHKVEEAAKHPDQEGLLIQLVSGISLMGGAAVSTSAIVAHGNVTVVDVVSGIFLAVPVAIVLIMGIMLPLAMFGVRVKGPAAWRENYFHGQFVPASILALAREARQIYGSRLIIGELIQDRVLLDPYLILCVGSERACLGIWDGETVIAIATRTEGDV